MKRLTTLLFTTLAAFIGAGQLAAAEPESSFGLAPSTAPQAAPTEPATDSPLIPEALSKPLTKEEAKAAAYKGVDKTAAAEDKLDKLIELRVATAKAERDPGLQAIKARALVARTDYEQRAIYIDYYTKLYDLIAKIDPKIKKEDIEQKKAMHTARFFQTRVEPTSAPKVARSGQN